MPKVTARFASLTDADLEYYMALLDLERRRRRRRRPADRRVGVRELAVHIGRAPSTTHVVLQRLVVSGYVDAWTDGTYRSVRR